MAVFIALVKRNELLEIQRCGYLPTSTVKANYRIRHRLIEQLPEGEIRLKLIESIWSDLNLESVALGKLWAVLSPGQRAFFAISLFESEVNNGGIRQFFYNESGVLASETLGGFNLLA